MLMEIFIKALSDAFTFIAFVGGIALLCVAIDKFIDWSTKFDLW